MSINITLINYPLLTIWFFFLSFYLQKWRHLPSVSFSAVLIPLTISHVNKYPLNNDSEGLPRWLSGKEWACQGRTHGFDPWVRKNPWRRKSQPTPVSLPRKSHGQSSLAGLYSMGSQEFKQQHMTVRRKDSIKCNIFLTFVIS